MSDLAGDLEKLILENLQKTVPAATQQMVKSMTYKDTSTKALGYTKLTRKGYTP